MRPDRQHKPDSLTFLFVFVALGMVVTSIAQAEDYLFGEPKALSSVMSMSEHNQLELHEVILPSSKNSWLLPGSAGVRTSFKGGMAHIQFDSSDEGDVSSLLPGNTRFILSMGLEETEQANQPGGQNHLDSQEWYNRYKPMLYFTLGHRW